MAIPPPKAPRLVVDALYAPATPTPDVAALLDVALTHHNCGRIDVALRCYHEAQVAWENCLLRAAAQDAGAAAEFDAVIADPSVLDDLRKPQIASEHDDQDEPSAALMMRQLADAERKDRLQKVDRIIARRATCLPAEHRIFIHLAVASVFTTDLDDNRALAELSAARRLLVGSVPVYHASLLAANVNSALGVAYFHVSQYDFAADYFFRCLETRESLCGADHVDTAAAINNVAATLFVLGRISDALVLFNRALAIVTAQLPPAHPRVDAIGYNTRLAKDGMLSDATFAPIPFTPYAPAMIPGAKRALQAKQPKPKKAAAAATDKKGAKK